MKTKLILAAVALFAAGFASAATIRATITFPDGVEAGRAAPVQVRLENAQEAAGAPVSLLFDGGQNTKHAELPIGRVGAVKDTTVTAEVNGPHTVGLRFNDGTKHYGQVAQVLVPLKAGTQVVLDIDEPLTRAHFPIGQYLAWFLGACVLGLIALRGAPAFD